MKSNLGNADKAVRIFAAIAIAVLFFTNAISGIVAIILLILGGVFVLTSFIGFCPLYHFFGISTTKKIIKSQEK